MLPWIGLALLSVSWLLGLGYYHPAPDLPVCTILTLSGAALMLGLSVRMPLRREALAAVLLMLPAVFLAPRPYREAMLLIVAGLILCALPASRRPMRYVHRAGAALSLAGCLLMVQALAMLWYEAVTARSHELPAPLPQVLWAVANALGIDAAVYQTTVPLFSMRKVHLLGSTWELLVDPPTFCFLVSAAVLVCWRKWSELPHGAAKWPLLRAWGTLLVLAAIWLPVRAGLLMAAYLNDVLRTDYDAPLRAMWLFWNPWIHLALLAGPVLLAWRFLPLGRAAAAPPPGASPGTRMRLLAALLVFAAAAVSTAAVLWEPLGQRKQGRVVFEEYHPPGDKNWEPTTRPFDTAWYGNLSGYNYYCVYDYCSRFYQVSRSSKPLDDDALRGCDVLVIKVPTRRFDLEEIDCIHRFVADGGGLLLIGEHTDVFGVGRNLNAICREFGFTYRYDCLFGIDKVFEQRYDLPIVPHPAVQNLGALDFATSCSIDPGFRLGRAVIRSAGLKSLLADYHADNYYPQPDDRAEMRYGAFVQLWSTRYAKGRVLAFTDSTIFSNFCAFEPGKSELLLGMLEWLNHQSGLPEPMPWLAGLGLALLLGGVRAARGWDGAALTLVGAALAGWAVAVAGIRAEQARAMPLPTAQRPMVRVVMDRTVCTTPLPRNGFIAGQSDQFGIFERWILRLGYFTARRSGPSVFESDLIVFLQPGQPVPLPFREQLPRYVAEGGRVLVLCYPEAGPAAAGDSPQGADDPKGDISGPGKLTARELLEPFGIAVGDTAVRGTSLTSAQGWPTIPLASAAFPVIGGKPFAWLDGQPVGASRKYGEGSVTVVGFGSRFTDANMGVTGDVVPDEKLREVYQWEFSLLRAIIDREPWVSAPADRAARDGGPRADAP